VLVGLLYVTLGFLFSMVAVRSGQPRNGD